MARVFQFLCAIALLVGFGYVGVITLIERADAGRGMPDFSVYSSDDNGLLPLVKRQLPQIPIEPGSSVKFKPTVVSRPIYLTGHRGLYLIVEPGVNVQAPGLLGGEQTMYLPTLEQGQRVLEWVASDPANVLVLWGTQNTTIHEELGVSMGGSFRVEEDFPRAVIPLRTGYTEGIELLELEYLTPVHVPGRPHQVLWELPRLEGAADAEPAAVAIPHGQGLVLVIGDPSLLTTEGRKRGDNALVLTNIAAKHAIHGEILFDEYHHGFQADITFFAYMHKEGHTGWLIQLGVALAAGAWAVAIRLGPPTPRPAGARADAVDYAAAMARIYEGAGVSRWLADGLVRDFLAAVTAHVRLRRSAQRKDILAAWKKKHPDSLPELTRLLDWGERLETDVVGARELLHAAQAFDRFRQEHVHQATGNRQQATGSGTCCL